MKRPFVALLIAVLAVSACNGKGKSSQTSNPPPAPTTPTPTPTPTPPPTPQPPTGPPNSPPSLRLVANTKHAEMDGEISFTVNVTDAESRPDQLAYEWAAPAGAFTGAGQSVKWRAPRIDSTPQFFVITVTVTESFIGPNGPSQNVVTASYRVAVNNSQKELADIAGQFIADFIDSSNSPEYVCRNFTDVCRGRAFEIADVRANRQKYTINRSQSSWEVTKVVIDDKTDFATVTIRCRFVSTVKATGRVETATGDDVITAVYIDDRWYLCESRWFGSSRISLDFWARQTS